jgi:ribosome-binding factor A
MSDAQPEKRRARQLADQIKFELGWLIERKLMDPAKGFITITRVRLSSDLKYAKVYFSAMGSEEQRTGSEKALKRAVNFLRRELGKKLNIRYIPEIKFFFDDSLDYAEHMNSLFKKIDGQNDTQ